MTAAEEIGTVNPASSKHPRLKQLWVESRGKVVAALLGAIIATALTQHYAMLNFYRLVQYQHSTEILRSTRSGIGFLKQIEGELDDDIAALLSCEYAITIEFGEPHDTMSGFTHMMEAASVTETNAVELKKLQSVQAAYKSMSMTVAKVEKRSEE